MQIPFSIELALPYKQALFGYYGLSHSNEQSPPDWEEEGFTNRFNMILTVCSPNALKLIVSKWQTNFVNNPTLNDSLLIKWSPSLRVLTLANVWTS
ncbi:MAG: hypothetical protein ACTS6A_00825 [Candidatus Hodgkinia cicadicola]